MTPVKTRLLLVTFLLAFPLFGCSSDPGPSEPETQLAGKRPDPGGGGDAPVSPGLQLPSGSHTQSTMNPYPVPNPWKDPGPDGNEPVPNPWNGGGGQGGQNGGTGGAAAPDPHGGHPVYAAEGETLKDPR
jgi:hypothetical protein